MSYSITKQAALAAVQAHGDAVNAAATTLMTFVRERIASPDGRTEIDWLANHRSMSAAMRSTLGQRIKKASTPEGAKQPTYELGHDGAPREARKYFVTPFTTRGRNKPSPKAFLKAVLTVAEHINDKATTGIHDGDAVALVTAFITKNAGTKVIWTSPKTFGQAVSK